MQKESFFAADRVIFVSENFGKLGKKLYKVHQKRRHHSERQLRFRNEHSQADCERHWRGY